MSVVRLYRAEVAATNAASVLVYRIELTGLGSASPGPDVTNLEAWLQVKMTAEAPGSPVNYVWDQVTGPLVNLVPSGTNNVSCSYETPALLSDDVLTFRVRAQYADGSVSGEGTCTHAIVRVPIRVVMADGSIAPVRLTPVSTVSDASPTGGFGVQPFGTSSFGG